MGLLQKNAEAAPPMHETVQTKKLGSPSLKNG
jgi:hypothetical protein